MAEVQTLVDDTPLANLQGHVTGSQIPANIMRDAEYTDVSVRDHLGLNQFEALSLFTGATLVDSIMTFAQNDGGEVTITLPMGDGGMMDQRVLNPNHAHGSLDTLGDIQIDPQGKVYSTVPVPEGGVAGVGTFVRFDHPMYIGSFPGDPNELSVPLGTYYFETTNHKLRVTVNNAQGTRVWIDADWADLLPLNAQYRGNHDTDNDALFHLRMDGDVYHRDTGTRGIRQVSNFTPPVTAHIVYDAQRLAFFEDIPLPKRDLFVERSSLPDPTADGAPDLVYLTHDHSEGDRADAVITVGFTSNGVAGYSRGDLSSTLGSINVESPLLEVFGLGTSSNYLVESVYWDNSADLDEFEEVWINNTVYTLGSTTEVPGGAVFLARIEDYPTGLSTANLNINFERADGTFYYNDSTDDPARFRAVPDHRQRPRTGTLRSDPNSECPTP